jgi:hypothetical protein
LSRVSQCERLLTLLKSRSGWVGLDEILGLRIAQFSARILELRRDGYTITNRIERRDGKLLSSYKLLSEPATSAQRIQVATPQPTQAPPLLFSDCELQRTKRWVDPEEVPH